MTKMKIQAKFWKIEPAFRDDRGMIYDILENENIRHIGLIICEPGSTRANHYHKKATQWTYVIDGKIRIYTKDFNEKEGKAESHVLGQGDIIKHPPYMIHAVEAIEKSTLLILTDQPRLGNGYEEDTFRVKIA